MRSGIVWGALVFAADRASKIWASQALQGRRMDVIPDILSFTYAENTGMAFSLFSGYPRLLAALSMALIIAVAWYLRRNMRAGALRSALLGLLIGGGAGNLADRLAYGFVIDFIEPRFMRFAIFNIADVAVTVSAAVLMIINIFMQSRHTEEKSVGNG